MTKQLTGLVHSGGVIKINDSAYLAIHAYRNACKFSNFSLQRIESQNTGAGKHGFFSVAANQDLIHGNITYDYFYRSAIDTPVSINNIQQHNIRANFQVLIAKTIPVVFQINSRQSNSWLFRNYTDLSVQFNGQSYNSMMRDRLEKEVIQKIHAAANDSSLLNEVKKQERQQENNRQWLQEPKQLQHLIESRQLLAQSQQQLRYHLPIAEDTIRRKIDTFIASKENSIDSTSRDSAHIPVGKYTKEVTSLVSREDNSSNLLKDSVSGMAGKFQKSSMAQSAAGLKSRLDISKINQWTVIRQNAEKKKGYLEGKLTDSVAGAKEKASSFLEKYETVKKKYENGKKKLDSLQQAYKSAKDSVQQKIEDAKNAFSSGSSAAIEKKVKDYRVDSSRAFRLYKKITAIKQFSLGRSMVDYSELSAKNISITGVQTVYQDKIYLVLASGSVDYQFRDFVSRDYTPVKQYLNLFRIGVGLPEKNNLIFTLFQGRKQANFFTTANQPAVNKIFGITLQGKFRLNDNNYVVAEVAKSSYPQALAPNTTINNATNKTFNFSNHSNEAYSIQLFSRIASTDTRLYGQYKSLGNNFQSFSLFNINGGLTSWQARVDQYFLRKRLFITASVRTNDYSNPYLTNTFKTNTVFKSLQATMRIKKWPVLSIGYMPSSQVTSFNNQVIENQFYTLTASANYLYRMRKGYLNTGLIYTKFYNSAPDTAFVYYNAKSLTAYYNIIGNKITFNSFLTLSYSNTYNLVTIDEGLNYKIDRNLSAGGGLKWNRLNNQDNHLGYYGNVQFRINHVGDVNLSFDRGFIPGTTEKLRKNDFGRATYIKTF